MLMEALMFIGGVASGAWIWHTIAAESIESRGVDKYLRKIEENRQWWKDNPTGVKMNPSGMVEMRLPKPDPEPRP